MGLGASGAQRRQTLASTIIVLHTANACVPPKTVDRPRQWTGEQRL
jgi:hypothetical protein